MHYSFIKIFEESLNFFRNNIKILLLTVLILGGLFTLIYHLLEPSGQALVVLNSLTEKAQQTYGAATPAELTKLVMTLPVSEQQYYFILMLKYMAQLLAQSFISSFVITCGVFTVIRTLALNEPFRPTSFLARSGKIAFRIFLFLVMSIIFLAVTAIILSIIPILIYLLVPISIVWLIVCQIGEAHIATDEPKKTFDTFWASWYTLRNYPGASLISCLIIGIIMAILSKLMLPFMTQNLLIEILCNLFNMLIGTFASIYFYRLASVSNQKRLQEESEE